MKLLKRLLRWMLRTVIIAALIFIGVAISRYIAHRYRPGSVIVLKLDGPMNERSARVDFGLGEEHGNSLNVIRHALTGAADDPRIVGLAIKIHDPSMELAQAQELVSLVDLFRARGKWTTAYMETAGESGFGNLPYMVATAADEVSMMPQGEMNLLGVGMREVFARGTLDWMHIKPVFDAIGKYKTAANIFTEKDFTPPQREEDNALADSIYTQIVNTLAHRRHMSADAVRAIINRAPLTAAEGRKSGLLDRLEYEDEFVDRVKSYRGEHHDLINAQSYASPQDSFFGQSDKIAVIYGTGAIEQGQGGFDPLLSPGGNAMGSDDMIEAFKQAREDDSIRAVVFRINSPGGEVIASELIRHAVELCARRKPVVVSMSSYAASGGFWIATPAARLFADPGTLTGSIGVLGGKFDISGAAAALGLNTGSIQRGQNADMFDSFTDFTPDQARLFHNQILGDTYHYFVSIVAQQRHLTFQQVDAIAQGRVWTGEQALQVKLIDYLGGFDAALNEAKLLAKLNPHAPVELVELPEQLSPLMRLLTGQLRSQSAWSPPRALRPILTALRETLAREGALGEVYCPLIPRM